MIADHFLFKRGDRFLEACGLNRNWPNNRGIFHNNEKTFLVWVNEEDQLRIISMQQGSNIRQVYDRLWAALVKFNKTGTNFSFDNHLGFHTSCPTNLGTGLRASVHIKLPYLAKEKALFDSIANKYHVQIRGIHGEHTETDDGVFDISNKRRLGFTMLQLVQDMYNGVKAMIEKEKELAAKNKPVEKKPEPVKEQPKPEPIIEQPKPEPVKEQPKPVVEQPKPEAPKAEPPKEEPKHVDNGSQGECNIEKHDHS